MVQTNHPIYKYPQDNPRDVYFSARSVFPFDLFPDEIIIDENKVDLIYATFLIGREVFSVPIKNINSVSSASDGIFASITIEVIGFHKDPAPIRFLWPADAAKARRIINGLVCSNRLEPTASVPKSERVKNVEQIGEAQPRI